MKYGIARTLLRDIPGPVDGLTRRVAEDVRVAYKLERDEHTEAELTHLIPDASAPRFAFAGSPEVNQRADRCPRGLGVDEIILAILRKATLPPARKSFAI
jgi:hypothetical protein